MAAFQRRAPLPADPDYWLRNCVGYAVYSSDGRVGVVDEVVEVDGEPALLTVRAGLFKSSTRSVSAAAVSEVLPREMRVVVRTEA